MIIPVGINHVIRGLPWVTISIIVLCTGVQLYSAQVAPSPEEVLAVANQRSRELEANPDDPQHEQHEAQAVKEVEELANRIPIVRFGYRTGSGVSWRLISSAFVHGGWLHLIGNMLFLWLTGAALEDRWGRLRFAGFYLLGAAAATLFFSVLHSGPETTLVGASGAISALMGAFLVCFSRMQIHFVYWFGFRAGTFHTVGYIALPLWFGEQVLEATMVAGRTGVSSVAFTAHIGGFLFGLAVAAVAHVVAQRDELPRAVARPSAPMLPPTPAKPIAPPKPQPPLAPGDGPKFLG